MVNFFKRLFYPWKKQNEIAVQLRKQANTLKELNDILDCMIAEAKKDESIPKPLLTKLNNKHPKVICPVCNTLSCKAG